MNEPAPAAPSDNSPDTAHVTPEKGAMQFIIITGLSGAGKALATRHFEDFGFFCVDNLPPALIVMFAELCARGDIGRVALVTDVRGGTFFNDLSDALEKLSADGFRYRILFLDAEDELLIQRFKETRRRHPLSEQYPDLQEAIAAERQALLDVRARADMIVNTSHVTPRELREQIKNTFLDEPDAAQMLVRVESFGFKHGLPTDADLVFDARFLRNPNYDRVIGHLDGNCQPVVDYVMREALTQDYLRHLREFVGFCLPQFEKEGKAYLTIAIGCTGGRHRSVVLSNWLAGHLRPLGYRVSVSHRDLGRSEVEGAAKGGSVPAPAERAEAPRRRALDAYPDYQAAGDGDAAEGTEPRSDAPANEATS